MKNVCVCVCVWKIKRDTSSSVFVVLFNKQSTILGKDTHIHTLDWRRKNRVSVFCSTAHADGIWQIGHNMENNGLGSASFNTHTHTQAHYVTHCNWITSKLLIFFFVNFIFFLNHLLPHILYSINLNLRNGLNDECNSSIYFFAYIFR